MFVKQMQMANICLNEERYCIFCNFEDKSCMNGIIITGIKAGEVD